MIDETVLREQLIAMLRGGEAHAPVAQAIEGVGVDSRGRRPPGGPHSPWEILEHLRITQWDILEYVRNPSHVSPEWPRGYWPAEPEPRDQGAWKKSHDAFLADLAAVERLVADPASDLTTPIPHGLPGHTLLREAILVADHNAYHGAEMVLVRRLLGDWPAKRS